MQIKANPPKEITFEELMSSLSAEFEEIEDHRRGNAKYKLVDMFCNVFLKIAVVIVI